MFGNVCGSPEGIRLYSLESISMLCLSLELDITKIYQQWVACRTGCYLLTYHNNTLSRVTLWCPPYDSSMLSAPLMSSSDKFSPGTQSTRSLVRREWTWHRKSNGDSWATDHRGQSCTHRKCIPSPHSHCPHWCLFKLGPDTWRDYFSTQISSHSTLDSNALKVPLSFV